MQFILFPSSRMVDRKVLYKEQQIRKVLTSAWAWAYVDIVIGNFKRAVSLLEAKQKEH